MSKRFSASALMLPQWEIDGSGQVVLGVLLAGQDLDKLGAGLDPAAQMLTVNFPRQGYLLEFHHLRLEGCCERPPTSSLLHRLLHR